MGTVVLENENGVQIRDDDMEGRHHKAHNALCECGESLIVAPPVYHPDHRKGDPVMICGDFGVHAYRFQNLVQGKQPAGTAA